MHYNSQHCERVIIMQPTNHNVLFDYQNSQYLNRIYNLTLSFHLQFDNCGRTFCKYGGIGGGCLQMKISQRSLRNGSMHNLSDGPSLSTIILIYLIFIVRIFTDCCFIVLSTRPNVVTVYYNSFECHSRHLPNANKRNTTNVCTTHRIESATNIGTTRIKILFHIDLSKEINRQ